MNIRCLQLNKYILVLLLFISYSVNAQHGLENIIVEKYYISTAKDTVNSAIGGKLPIGSTTYRIYVDLLPGYKFQAAFGIPGHELRIATTTSFFNNEDQGATIPNIIPDHNLGDNTVMLDSWISVGAASESNLGVLKAEDNGQGTIKNANGILRNENPMMGISLINQDGLIEGVAERVTAFGIDSIIKIFGNSNGKYGSEFKTSNGSWAAMNGSVGPTSENKILIAQLTTNGKLSFKLNIQIGTPSGGVEQYVAENPQGNQIKFSKLSFPLPIISHK